MVEMCLSHFVFFAVPVYWQRATNSQPLVKKKNAKSNNNNINIKTLYWYVYVNCTDHMVLVKLVLALNIIKKHLAFFIK